jgi:mannose-6-phosphate isomerase-like protein (cupin superfamily)
MSLLFLALSFIGLVQGADTVRTVEPGVVATTLMDRAEVRILRVEIAPGASRQVHTHNDVEFHVFVPISGTVQLAVGSERPVEVDANQAQFFKANTPHGWRNAGTVKAEIR